MQYFQIVLALQQEQDLLLVLQVYLLGCLLYVLEDGAHEEVGVLPLAVQDELPQEVQLLTVAHQCDLGFLL